MVFQISALGCHFQGLLQLFSVFFFLTKVRPGGPVNPWFQYRSFTVPKVRFNFTNALLMIYLQGHQGVEPGMLHETGFKRRHILVAYVSFRIIVHMIFDTILKVAPYSSTWSLSMDFAQETVGFHVSFGKIFVHVFNHVTYFLLNILSHYFIGRCRIVILLGSTASITGISHCLCIQRRGDIREKLVICSTIAWLGVVFGSSNRS
jgi:hypothetical protein